MFVISCLIMVYYVSKISSESDYPSCNSPIYCQGELLHTVQTTKLYDDSKHFVDMMMKFDENVILENFKQFMQEKGNKSTNSEVENFVNQNFAEEGGLEFWIPEDYSPEPPFLKNIFHFSYREFARNLIPIWKILGRKIKPHVTHEKNNSRFSIIPVPNSFIVPGGRFREFYYWDSYWIIVGLLHSGMSRTVKGMLDNYLWIVKTHGYIPNGGRIYYLNRSQPPMFIMMVHEFLKYSGEGENNWLKKNIHVMEMELGYWLKKKTISFSLGNKEYTLARYIVNSSSPRPESYHEDLTTCSIHKTDDYRNKCYRELKSAAESGWDYSSRWMTEKLELSDLKLSEIAPVDLNAFLTRSFYLIAKMFSRIGIYDKHTHWLKIFEKWSGTMHRFMYNEEDGIWYDFDVVKLKQNRQFFCSNFAPLWAPIFTRPTYLKTLGNRAADYLINNNIMNFSGGIPTSLYNSGEQWDLPNAWPNLQSIVILGLYRSGDENAKEIAETLAHRWISANLHTFEKTKTMYAKYNAETFGEPGKGGDYVVQTGFAWSNGVILELINEIFSKEVGAKKKTKSSACKNIMFGAFTSLFIIIFSRKIS